MAKKKQEDPPKGSPAWMSTFSDLMNLLLCFFVLLFSMATVDAAKFELVVNSLRSAFSVLPSGGETIAEGQLIGGGIMAMPEYSNNFGDTLADTEGNEIEDGTDTTMQEGGGTDNEVDTQQGPGMNDGETSQPDTPAEVNPESTQSPESSQSAQGQNNQNQQGAQGQDQQASNNQDTSQGGAQTQDQQGAPSQDQQQGAQDQQASDVSVSQAQEVIDEEALEESRKMAENLEAMTTFYGIQDNVQVDYNGQFVRLTLNGAVLFNSGSADIKPQAYTLVDNVGHILDGYQESLIQVEGHTDTVPIHSAKFESNDVLSMYRALSVANRLRDASTVNRGNIMSAGRGSYAPIADNGTPEGRARNRRVEVKIYNSFYSDLAKQ